MFDPAALAELKSIVLRRIAELEIENALQDPIAGAATPMPSTMKAANEPASDPPGHFRRQPKAS